MPEVSGDFEWMSEFHTGSLGEANWLFLLDGHGRLILTGRPSGMPIGCSAMGPEEPVGFIEEVTLFFEGDFAVQAETRSWGALKVIYR